MDYLKLGAQRIFYCSPFIKMIYHHPLKACDLCMFVCPMHNVKNVPQIDFKLRRCFAYYPSYVFVLWCSSDMQGIQYLFKPYDFTSRASSSEYF